MIYPVPPGWLRRLTEAWSRIAFEEAQRMPAAAAAAWAGWPDEAAEGGPTRRGRGEPPPHLAKAVIE